MTQFISRELWGSAVGAAGYWIGKFSEYVVIHHTPGQDGGGDFETAAQEVRNIERSHINNGWKGIGYTWLVSGDYAFEGRGYGYSGAHAPGANSNSVGLAFLLDGRHRAPTETEWQTAAAVARQGVEDKWLIAGFGTTGHRDWVATECPAHYPYIDLGHLRNAMAGVVTFPPPVPPALFGTRTLRRGRIDTVQGQLRHKADGRTVDVFDWDFGDKAGRMPAVAYDFALLPVGAVVAVHGRYPGLDQETGHRWAQLVWRNGREDSRAYWHGTNARLGPVTVPVFHTVVVPQAVCGKVLVDAFMPTTTSETTVPL